MNSIAGISGTGSNVDGSSQTTGTVQNPKNSLGEDQFLLMLVTELKNQDPLQPLDNSQYIAQLATFSSLEKLTSIESLLKQSLESQAAGNQTSQQKV